MDVVRAHRFGWVVVCLTFLGFAAGVARWMWLGQVIPRERILLPTVRLLSYESFAGVIGPGPQLIRQFESRCQCRVEVSTASEGGLLLEKLKLAQSQHAMDVVIGLDQLLLPEAQRLLKWKKLRFRPQFWEPKIQPFVQNQFVPLDWAPLTFIYRQGEIDPPENEFDLIAERFKETFSLEDPRTSSPGLQLLYAMYSWVGEKNLFEYWRRLKPNVHSVSPTWSSAYGLFQRRQAKITFSYITSLVYHWAVEKDMSYRAAVFSQGHPVQVEYMGLPENCQQCDLAEKFLRFLLEPESQKLIMEKNFMFPVRPHLTAAPSVFSQLPHLKLLPSTDQSDFRQKKLELEELWLKAMQ